MFRTFLTTTALAAAATNPALAEGTTSGATDTLVVVAADSVEADASIPMQSSTIVGTDVYSGIGDAEADPIATISDMIITTDGAVDGVVLSVGGLLDIGDTDVRVSWNQLDMERTDSGDARITIDMTAEQLEAKDAFIPFDERDNARLETDEAMIETENEMMRQRADLAPSVAPAIMRDREWALRNNYTEVVLGDVSAERLFGAYIYGASDQHLGDVSDVILSASGDIEAIIVDFGGFLGIGEKPVAVQFDTVSLMRDNATDAVAVFTGLTDADLENAAEYNDETYGALGATLLDAS